MKNQTAYTHTHTLARDIYWKVVMYIDLKVQFQLKKADLNMVSFTNTNI